MRNYNCWLSYVANRDKLLNNIFLLWFVACAWTRKTSNRKITSVVIFLQTNFKYQNRLLKKPMGNKIIYYYFEPDIHTLQPFYLLHVNNIWMFLSLRESSYDFECVSKVTFFNSFIDTKWSPFVSWYFDILLVVLNLIWFNKIYLLSSIYVETIMTNYFSHTYKRC